MTRTVFLVVAALASLSVLASSAFGLKVKAVEIREDYRTEPLSSCYLNYYYYAPDPTTAWFWEYSGWHHDDRVGAWFEIGDITMGQSAQCDPVNCQTLSQFRVLDFAGYGCYRGGVYAGEYTVRFDIYCADENGSPVGPPLWTSPNIETCVGWNYIPVSPPLSLCRCGTVPGPPRSRPRILVTATHVGSNGSYPAWGVDNISTPVGRGSTMHDLGCLPALYPRPYNSYYPTMHSGYYGNGGFWYSPPQWFTDPGDPTPDATRFGYLELGWRVYLSCNGPSKVEPTTWGSIKAIYK